MAIVYLLIGGNEGNREKNISLTCDYIIERIGKIIKSSSIYESEPWGFKANNNFLNQAISVETDLNPTALLKEISYIEAKLGRVRNTSAMGYQSRTMDIDIIFYDNITMNTPNLVIPHCHMHERGFVLKPICEIAPDYVHPLLLEPVKQLTQKCTDKCKVWLYPNSYTS